MAKKSTAPVATQMAEQIITAADAKGLKVRPSRAKKVAALDYEYEIDKAGANGDAALVAELVAARAERVAASAYNGSLANMAEAPSAEFAKLEAAKAEDALVIVGVDTSATEEPGSPVPETFGTAKGAKLEALRAALANPASASERELVQAVVTFHPGPWTRASVTAAVRKLVPTFAGSVNSAVKGVGIDLAGSAPKASAPKATGLLAGKDLGVAFKGYLAGLSTETALAVLDALRAEVLAR